MSKDRPTQLYMGETSVNEILDGMDIRFGTSPRPLVNGDSIAVQSAKGFFHFLVQRPEGDFGAVVSLARASASFAKRSSRRANSSGIDMPSDTSA